MNNVWKFNMEYLSFKILTNLQRSREYDGGTQITE